MTPSTLRRAFHVVAAVVLATLVFTIAWTSFAEAGTKLLRFPDIHGDRWSSATPATSGAPPPTAGTATASPPTPAWSCSPSSRRTASWIAFTGQYDGDEQVYVDPRRRRRAPAAHLLPGPRAAAAALGLRQPGLRLDARRRARCCSARCATAGSLTDTRLYTVSTEGGLPAAAAHARSRARAISRPTASRSSTRRCSATSAPGSATRAAGPRISTSSTWPATTLRRITDASAHRPRSDVDRRQRSTSAPTATAR